MIDTIKILLLPQDLNCSWDISELRQKLEPFEKYHRVGFKPLGFVKGTFSVSGTNSFLIVEGSLAKFSMRNNVDNFDWSNIKPAIKMLSAELGLPVERGQLRRIDIAGNICLNEPVTDYFPELNNLNFYQKKTNRKTTLRFESNQETENILFYDKLAESTKKTIQNADAFRKGCSNLMRFEVQLQKRVVEKLGFKKVIKVIHLYRPSFYKKLLETWYMKYCRIEKKAIMVLPKNIKGRKDIDRFIFRFFVETLGWDKVKAMLNNAQSIGSLTPDAKSKKLRQLQRIMQDDTSFEFKAITGELTSKIDKMYQEGLEEIDYLDRSNSKP